MPPTSTKRSRTRRWIETLLLMAGMLGVSAWLVSMALPIMWQDWENWVFDHELLGKPATISGYLDAKQQEIVEKVSDWLGRAHPPVGSTPPPETHKDTHEDTRRPIPRVQNNALVGRLAIPRLGLTAIVREGVGDATLGLAVGHIPGTALPGQNGNVAVAGHRDTLFRGLGAVRKNDLIQVETLDGNYTYKVASTQIVKPRDVSVLNPGKYPELTLVTCYPFYYIGSAPERFIVKARQVSSSIHSPEPAEAEAEAAPTIPAPQEHIRAVADEHALNTKPPIPGRIVFSLERAHSRTLAPGISIGLDNTNVGDQRMNGWMWIMPDRRTIWLRNQGIDEPVVFYGFADGKRRELRITSITDNTVSGYLVLPAQ